MSTIGELLRWKTDVFGYNQRSLGTSFADEAKQAFAHVPRQLDRLVRGQEVDRLQQFDILDRGRDLIFLALELLHTVGSELNQQGGCLRIQRFPVCWRLWKCL